MNYISEAAKKDADYQLQGLIDGMERNDYKVFEDVECMHKNNTKGEVMTHRARMRKTREMTFLIPG